MIKVMSFLTSGKGLIALASLFLLVIAQYEIRLVLKNNTIESSAQDIKDLQSKITTYELSEALLKSNVDACHVEIDKINANLEALKVKPKEIIKTVEKIKLQVQRVPNPINESCQEKLKLYESQYEVMNAVR